MPLPSPFESCVIPEGSQTAKPYVKICIEFESCVIPEGSQTMVTKPAEVFRFESCVIPEGSQTKDFAAVLEEAV